MCTFSLMYTIDKHTLQRKYVCRIEGQSEGGADTASLSVGVRLEDRMYEARLLHAG